MSSKGDINTQIALFAAQLKRRQISGSKEVALATANMLIRFISARRWTSSEKMVEQVSQLGAQLEAAQPYEFTCGNVIRRVLKNIRTINEAFSPTNGVDESGDHEDEVDGRASMFGLLSVNEEQANENELKSKDDLTPSGYFASEEARVKSRDLRNAVIDEIHLLIDEINNDDPLFKAGVEMINNNDVLLTPCPSSSTVLDFLLRAAAKRQFSVIVTESYPNNIDNAKIMVTKLNAQGIIATLVPDAAVYAVMAKVSKVLISGRTVLANGGCIAASGVTLTCHAAKQFTKPVLSIAGSYKLSPIYPFDVENLIEVGNSGKVINFGDAELMDKLEVINPLYDYISPELVDIIISSDGGVSPNFVYRLILDNYSVHDQSFHPITQTPAQVTK